jgi:hypothetical protein
MRIIKEKPIPFFEGPSSVKPAGWEGRGREVEWKEDDTEYLEFVEWPNQYKRKYKPLRDPDDGHILSDSEIKSLLDFIRHGWRANKIKDTAEFLKFLTYRDQIIEQPYGPFDNDVAVCRFFDSPDKSGAENILADIRALNEKENAGNIKIPGTPIEIINYSPCPKCKHIHSFKDVFNYYMHPTRDPMYNTIREQHFMDTRVQCVECDTFFLPALIIADGTPRQEHQMICRAQTLREIQIYMKQEYKLNVLYSCKENILTNESGKSAWRNDINSWLLKPRPGLFSNFLQYTPAPLMLDFLSGKNLRVDEPVYGVWMEPKHIQYIEF